MTKKNQQPKLKPCPICGRQPKWHVSTTGPGGWYSCRDKGILVETNGCDSKEAQARRWNKRQP